MSHHRTTSVTYKPDLKSAVTCILLYCLNAHCAHAEIYKWVDANGQTHYSERKSANGNKTEAIQVKVTPPSPSSNTPPAPTPGARAHAEQFERQKRENLQQASSHQAAPSPRSLSGGISDETDASRCNLARDILSGAVRHTNGKPTDQYDRDTAQSDIKAFCH